MLGTPSQGVPRLAEYTGGQLTFFTSFSISILASVSEELTRSRRSEQQLKKAVKTNRNRSGGIPKQSGPLSAFSSEVLLRTDVKSYRMDERVSGPGFQNKTLVQGVQPVEMINRQTETIELWITSIKSETLLNVRQNLKHNKTQKDLCGLNCRLKEKYAFWNKAWWQIATGKLNLN